jgi:hypothetical protein
MRRSQKIEKIIKGLREPTPESGVVRDAILLLQREFDKSHAEEFEPRAGWECPDPEHEKWYGKPYEGPTSPDGVCVYYSQAGRDEHAGKRVVRLKIGADWVIHPLPDDHDEGGESEDWCVFCGQPDERK